MLSAVLCCGALGMEKGVVSSVSQSCPHLRAGTVSAMPTVTVLGVWWGSHKEEGVKGGLVGKLHIWE